jgi:hypothetical protein
MESRNQIARLDHSRNPFDHPLHFPLSDVLLYALCSTPYALSVPQLATRNAHATRNPQRAPRNSQPVATSLRSPLDNYLVFLL